MISKDNLSKNQKNLVSGFLCTLMGTLLANNEYITILSGNLMRKVVEILYKNIKGLSKEREDGREKDI